MSTWDDLKLVISELRAQQPSPLAMYPDPGCDGHQPPFPIGMEPWAVAAAEALHQRFGDQVKLTVGALPYPPGLPGVTAGRLRQALRPPAELLDPAEVSVALDGPAVVRSGQTLRHGLLVTNHTSRDLLIATNGGVIAAVVDPESGNVVGGYLGWQTLPLIYFQVAPEATERIPLLIGTASSAPEIGYVVPAGTWAIQVTLELTDSRRTPLLPLTVTG